MNFLTIWKKIYLMSCNLTILYRSKGTCILLKRVSLLYFFSTPGKVTKYSVFIILIYHSLKYMVLLCFLENVLLFFSHTWSFAFSLFLVVKRNTYLALRFLLKFMNMFKFAALNTEWVQIISIVLKTNSDLCQWKI